MYYMNFLTLTHVILTIWFHIVLQLPYYSFIHFLVGWLVDFVWLGLVLIRFDDGIGLADNITVFIFY